MQPIERYALVTLLFLVVLVMVVALWDDGSKADARSDNQEVARLEETRAPAAGEVRRASETPRRQSGGLPISGQDDPAPSANRVRTRTNPATRHSVEPGADPDVSPVKKAPVPPSVADLKNLARPIGAGSSMRPVGGSTGTPPGTLVAKGSTGPSGPSASGGSTSSGMSEVIRPVDQRKEPVTPPAKSADRPTVKPEPSGTQGGTRRYVIRSGDSLERIARRELGDATKIDLIADLNGLSKPFTIYEGETLELPARSDVASNGGASPKTPARVPVGNQKVYTFRRGDILSLVLQREFGTYKRSIGLVKELNPGINPDRIVEGTRILLPSPGDIPGGVEVAKATPRDTAPRPRKAASSGSEFVVR